MYTYQFSEKARKELLKLERELQLRIIEKIEYVCNSPSPLIYSERLNNLDIGNYRLRVGDYRIIFDLQADNLKVLKVGHRREIYK